MRKVLLSFLMLLTLFSCSPQKKDKTVLLAILARNKEHTLPKFLECIHALDYDKQSIVVYINTNNNVDGTEELLRAWARLNESAYKKIVFESHDVKELAKDETKPHEWTSSRFKTLAQIREKSLKKTLEYNCDYYFVVDCDNFITPQTLKSLVQKDKPIIAPMLISLPGKQTYSNFFCAVNDYGYWDNSEFYPKIVSRSVRGTFNVPVVHCSYLIKAECIDKLGYLDGTDDYEFVIFSRIARKNGIKQFICNEEDFGFQIHPLNPKEIDLEGERQLLNQILRERAI